METRFSLCPDCDACPEVVIDRGSVLIGEEGNQVELSAGEWNVLVAAIREDRLGFVEDRRATGDRWGGRE